MVEDLDEVKPNTEVVQYRNIGFPIQPQHQSVNVKTLQSASASGYIYIYIYSISHQWSRLDCSDILPDSIFLPQQRTSSGSWPPPLPLGLCRVPFVSSPYTVGIESSTSCSTTRQGLRRQNRESFWIALIPVNVLKFLLSLSFKNSSLP